jgi:hypothetical protein
MERLQFIKQIREIYRADPSDEIPTYLFKIKQQFSQPQWNFLKSLIRDRKRIQELFKSNQVGKKGGISGSGIPITVKILNRDDKNPALEKYTGYQNQWIVVYFGISPELENFVSIVMWPSESETSKSCYSAIYDTLDEPERVIMLEGAYSLRPPNEIHPQNVQKVLIDTKEKPFYDWRYFPFIKDVGESLAQHISGVNYRSVLLRDRHGELVEDYVTVRVAIGSVLDLQGDEIKVKMPFLRDHHHPITFRLPRSEIEPPRKGRLYYFLLLERAGERVPEILLFEHAQKMDALAHVLSFCLYNKFMSKTSGDIYRSYMVNKYTVLGRVKPKEMSDFFGICYLDEFKELCRDYIIRIYDDVYRSISQTEEDPPLYSLSDIIYNSHLSSYFKLDANTNTIYYDPPIFHQKLTKDDFLPSKVKQMNSIIRLNLSVRQD